MDLVVPDSEPGGACADEIAVHAERICQRDDSTVADTAETAAFEVVDRQSQQFGKKQQAFRHRKNVRIGYTTREPGRFSIRLSVRSTWVFLFTMTHQGRYPQAFFR